MPWPFRRAEQDDCQVLRDAADSDVIFVHGTWSRSASWSRQHGRLDQVLRNRNEAIKIYDYQWRGGNRFGDRYRAARLLSHILQDCQRNVVLIAHSHGGNVAAMATAIEPETQYERRIITLGTPFIVFEPWQRPRRRSQNALITLGLSLMLIAGGTAGLIASPFFTIGLAATAVVLALSILSFGAARRTRDEASLILEAVSTRPPRPLVVVASAGDEARIGLGLNRTLTMLGSLLRDQVLLRSTRLAFQLAVWPLSVWGLWHLRSLLSADRESKATAQFPSWVGDLAINSVAVASAALVIIGVVVMVDYVGVGIDALRFGGQGHFLISPVPPGAHIAIVVDVPRRRLSKTLDHSRLTADLHVQSIVRRAALLTLDGSSDAEEQFSPDLFFDESAATWATSEAVSRR